MVVSELNGNFYGVFRNAIENDSNTIQTDVFLYYKKAISGAFSNAVVSIGII